MSWQDVEKGDRNTNEGSRFVQFPEGTTLRMRILDSEPFTTRVHKISQPVRRGDKVEEVFRTIPATQNVDDNYVLAQNGKRYPEVMQYNIRVWLYAKDDSGRDTDAGEFKILQGGAQIFKHLLEMYQQNNGLNDYDIFIKREGSKRDTKYFVSAAPVSKNIDIKALQAALAADADMQWENLFAPVTGADQQRMIKEAGFDITYDPAGALAKEMSIDDALNTKFTFGKYGQKGNEKSIRDLIVMDSGYVQWAAENVTSDDRLAAACQVAVGYMAQLESGAPPAPQIAAPKPAQTPVSPAKPPAQPSEERKALEASIGAVLEKDPKFQDLTTMLTVLRKHGNGKTRVKDFTVEQMKTLLADISGQ